MMDDTPPRDLHKIFDLDRTQLTTEMVNRMEECMRQAMAATIDLKAVVDECRKQQIHKDDIAAMKRIAKLRATDKVAEAREALLNLERISRAVQCDLFSWVDRE